MFSSSSSFFTSLTALFILLLFIKSVGCVVSPTKEQSDAREVIYHTISRDENTPGAKEKKWTYLTLMPGEFYELRYIIIDYFTIDAHVFSGSANLTGVDIILQRGLQFQNEERDPRTGIRRDFLRCRNVTSCFDRMRLHYADYILRFSNPTMQVIHIRYNVETRDDTTALIAQAILLFFIAGIVCPLVTVTLVIYFCCVKAQQYLMYCQEGKVKKR